MANGVIESKIFVFGRVHILWTATLICTLDVCHHCHFAALRSKVWICDHRDCEVLQITIMDQVLIFFV